MIRHRPRQGTISRAVITATLALGLVATTAMTITSSALLLAAERADPVDGITPTGPCLGGAMQVVAHQDDDLLFLSPDLLHDIQAGRCVRTVYTTAGDAGEDESYWADRELGAMAAYAAMAGVGNDWTTSTIDVGDISVRAVTLDEASGVSLVFLRLPDGGRAGAGMPATGYRSLMYLWDGTIGSVTTVDGTATYTTASLTRTLATLMADFAPMTIRTQDWTVGFHSGDSSDHVATAMFARKAAATLDTAHTTLAYGGYPTWTRSANVAIADVNTKASTVLTYADHDPQLCTRPWCPVAFMTSLRVARQYVVATESPTNVARDADVTVTASSQSAGTDQGAAKVVDGMAGGYPGSAAQEWCTDGQTTGTWVQIDLPHPVKVDTVVLYDRPNTSDQITAATLVFSDGTTVPAGPLADNGSAVTITFPERTVTSVRLVIDEVSATTTAAGLAELEIHTAGR